MDVINRQILEWLRQQGSATGSELARRLGLSRQAVHKRLRKLEQQGLVVRVGRTRAARYYPAPLGPRMEPILVRKTYEIGAVEEDEAFQEISVLARLREFLNENALRTVQYIFTEVLNNALEHSGGKRVRVQVRVLPRDRQVEFVIRDTGVGLFRTLQQALGLKREADAILWLLPGKSTTAPERHTGEGLFFAAKLAREMTLWSHRLALHFLQHQQEVRVETRRYLKGTEVHFVVPFHLHRSPEKVFHEYAPATYDYQFERSRVVVHVLWGDLIARSQARRLLQPVLGRFREVVLDFARVRSVGQGFLDEALRVIPSRHPETRFWVRNVPESLRPLVLHAVDKNRVVLVDNPVDNGAETAGYPEGDS